MFPSVCHKAAISLSVRCTLFYASAEGVSQDWTCSYEDVSSNVGNSVLLYVTPLQFVEHNELSMKRSQAMPDPLGALYEFPVPEAFSDLSIPQYDEIFPVLRMRHWTCPCFEIWLLGRLCCSASLDILESIQTTLIWPAPDACGQKEKYSRRLLSWQAVLYGFSRRGSGIQWLRLSSKNVLFNPL